MASYIEYIDPITPKLVAATKFVTSYVDAVLEFNEQPAQTDMRTNAPWQDQTGNARQGLFAQAYVAGDEHGLVLYHTVPYGIFLETRWSGRYRIIVPALHRTGRKVMTDLKQIMRML